MEVVSSAMGPERILPNSEDELGEEEERPAEGALPGGEVWSEGGGEEEEEEEDGNDSGGYYYQPLTQDPDGLTVAEPPLGEENGGGVNGELQEVQERIEAMGLHLPPAPPPDSDEEDVEGAAAQRSHASIPMDEDHVELVKRTMAAVALPSLGIPAWAQEISDDQWKDMVQHTLETRQSAAALRLHRKTTGN
ncbi:male-enhanced antigen 1 [Diretmus argenteus]